MGGLLYLYGLVPSEEVSGRSFPTLKGFDGKGDLFTIQIENITAIVCYLAAENYSEESIKERINNDMEWLQEKAFHHHETVMQLSKIFTIIPLKFCTLYHTQDSLETSVHSNESKIAESFALIDGTEEWNLKIYCDDALLKKQVSQNNDKIEAKRAEINRLPKGKQFFAKKKLDKLIETELEEEKIRVSETIHLHLKELALKGNVKSTWSNEATGRKDNMTWNGVYLVSQSKVDSFLEQIQQYDKNMREKGWQFKATGPWPAYHFSSVS
ncbi:GvpL/GvpF family gas vesicle protein [Paenibacillus xerothermodurans]|uniref:Gas vesicle protein GvpL n=1 Tax=Paenibacillus xerothermodurans TaxID=1977292 RepID=A0A2W1N791_PAEXE|nr:GvpL/GvpF family gas vesicle protein [Paenibacillus xerothermodurans]PZE19704.1 gas vesicle protein GvpL [Paenibacillus xerothermodurans]